jgi:hypothetical protein
MASLVSLVGVRALLARLVRAVLYWLLGDPESAADLMRLIWALIERAILG